MDDRTRRHLSSFWDTGIQDPSARLFLVKRSKGRRVHTDDSQVPIAVAGNHDVVIGCQAVHKAVRLVAQGPSDGIGLVHVLQEADIAIICPRQYPSRALAQTLRHVLYMR
jgi:hypothetical protein